MKHHFLVVGGSRGLGKAFAATKVAEGHAVSVVARTPAPIDGATFHQCDLDDATATRDIVARACSVHGDIDGLVFCQRFRGAADSWEGELRTCLTATKSLIEMAVPHFAAAGLRSIVLVSSVNATFVSSHQPVGYHVAKAGLCELARYFACTLGPLGIRVNTICPSTFIKSENESFFASHPDVMDRLAALSPLRRMATSKDINDVVDFLLSRRASYVTGQAIVVDGGISLVWPERTS